MASPRTQLKRFMRAQKRPSVELCFWLHDVEDPVNVGAAFRIADACGAFEVLLTGITARPPHKLITKVGRNKDRRVRWREFDEPVGARAHLDELGFEVFAVEISESARAYYDVSYPDRTCLLVGHEDHGVPKKVRELCHHEVFIPMYGKGASLNVHVALGVLATHTLHHRWMAEP